MTQIGMGKVRIAAAASLDRGDHWAAMRRKIRGYVFQFTSADHGGRHIHVYRNERELGVFDRINGPVRGLECEMNAQLREGLSEFIKELNERGFFRR